MKNDRIVQKAVNDCNATIQQTITGLTAQDVYDTKVLTSLLSTKDTLNEFLKRNGLDVPFLA